MRLPLRHVAFAAALTLFSASTTLADDKPNLKMGMVQGMFRDVPPTMVQALSKPFRELVQKQTGFAGDVDLSPDAVTMIDKLRDKKLHLGVFHGFEFAWAQKRCEDLVPIVITIPPGNKVQAMLVVGCECKMTGINQLKDKSVAIPRGAKAHSLAFMEKLQSQTKFKTTFNTAWTPEDALHAVANGEVDAVLVDNVALDGFHILQPGAKNRIKTLVESEQFPPAVVAYRKGMITDADAETIRKGLSTAHTTANGKVLMALWNLKGLVIPPDDYQTKLDTILKSYPSPTFK